MNDQINELEANNNLHEKDSVQLLDFQFALVKNQEEKQSLMSILEKNFPTYYDLTYNPKILTIKEIQNNLGQNEGLLEYFVGKENSFIISISKRLSISSN